MVVEILIDFRDGIDFDVLVFVFFFMDIKVCWFMIEL